MPIAIAFKMYLNFKSISFRRILIHLILIFNLKFESGLGLKILGVKVPPIVSYGQSAVLRCDFDLEGEDLYCVRYFKDDRQFYSYCPGSHPQGQLFGARGIYMDIGRSNASHVFLTKTDLSSSGTYECQVRSRPSMMLRRSECLMSVYSVPSLLLNIEGQSDHKCSDEAINMICFSDPSIPVAQLSWFINDQMASEEMLTRFSVGPKSRKGWQSAKLGLHFQKRPDLFRNGAIKLSCRATFKVITHFEATEWILNGRPIPKKSYWLGIRANNSEVPVIEGVKPKYSPFDTLELNCTSTAPEVHLEWMVNEDLVVDSSRLISYDRDRGRTISGLKMPLGPEVVDNELKIQCVAKVGHDVTERQENMIYIEANDCSTLTPTSTSTSTSIRPNRSSTTQTSTTEGEESTTASPDIYTSESSSTQSLIVNSLSTTRMLDDTDPPVTVSTEPACDYTLDNTQVTQSQSVTTETVTSTAITAEQPAIDSSTNYMTSVTNLTPSSTNGKNMDVNDIDDNIDDNPDAWISTVTRDPQWVTDTPSDFSPTSANIESETDNEFLYNLIFSLLFIIYDLHPLGLISFYSTNKCHIDNVIDIFLQ